MRLWVENLCFERVGPPITLTTDIFSRLREYSTTAPTGAKPGRVWKCDAHFYSRRRFGFLHPFDGEPQAEACGANWYLATVLEEDHPEGGKVIEFRKIIIHG